MERDMVPKDVLERYEKGEDINYKTAYGKGYITKEGHEKMKKYAINIEEPIEVSQTFIEDHSELQPKSWCMKGLLKKRKCDTTSVN